LIKSVDILLKFVDKYPWQKQQYLIQCN